MSLVFFFTSGISQDIPLNEKAFKDKERVVYKIFYNWKFVWIPAGEVTFEVIERDSHYLFHVTGTSYPSYDSFFKVRDDYVSRADKSNLLPFNFRRTILEGNYQRYDSISFNQDQHSLYELFGKTKDTAKGYDFQLNDYVLDMVSAIYYLRCLPFKDYAKDVSVPLYIFFDKEEFLINIQSKGIKKKKIKDLGKFETQHFQVDLIDGYVFKEGDTMDIWVTNDDNKVPISIESPISFGSVKAILKSAEGLKYESELNAIEYE